MQYKFNFKNFDRIDLTLVVLMYEPDEGEEVVFEEDYFDADGNDVRVKPSLDIRDIEIKNFEENIFKIDHKDQFDFVTKATYTSDYFEIGDLASFNVGGASTQTGTLKVKATKEDFYFFKAASMLKLVFSGENDEDINPNGEVTFMAFFVRHPIIFDGQYLTLTVDSIPSNRFVGWTTAWGEALPYSFGKTYVNPVLISKKNLGVSLETIDVLSFSEINEIFDAYSACLKPVLAAGRVGETADDITNLENILNYRLTILKAIDSHPKHAATLSNFLDLLNIVGTYQEDLMDEFGNKVRVSNLGLLLPLNLVDIIYSECYDTYFNTLKSDFYLKESIEEKLTYTNINDIGEKVANIKATILDWVNTLTELPLIMKTDFGEYRGPLVLNIDGKKVVGSANTHKLSGNTLEGVGAEDPTPYTFTLDSVTVDKVDNYKFEAGVGTAILLKDTEFDRNILGKYLYITATYENGHETSFTARVLNQVDFTSLTLDVLPYSSSQGYILKGAITAIADLPIPTVTSRDTIQLSSMPYPLDVGDGCFSVGDTFIRTRNVPYVSIATWPTESEPPSFEVQEAAEKYAVNLNSLKQYFVRYKKGDTEVTSEILKYEPDTGFFMREEPDNLTVEADCDSKETFGLTRLHLEDFSFNVKAGQELELYDKFEPIYIVDERAGCPIDSVYSKIGKALFKVPESWYTILPDYWYAGRARTAIVVPVPFSQMGIKDLSDDIVVLVDIGVHSDYTYQDNDDPQEDIPYSFKSCMTLLGLKYGYKFAEDGSVGSYLPRFTVYGFTSVMEIIASLVEESNCGFSLNYPYLDVVALNVDKQQIFTFDESNVESFTFETSDSLMTYTNTLFTWETFTPFQGKIHVSVPRFDDVTLGTSSKQITKYTDSWKIIEFAQYYMHRNGRNWEKINLVGFLDSLSLQPLDVVNVVIGDWEVLGEIQTIKYNHETGTPSFEILLNSTTYGYGHNLWITSDDVSTTQLDGIAGYTIENNTEFETYYNGNYYPPI